MDENQTIDLDRVQKINIEEEMKKSYIDYSMSVIVCLRHRRDAHGQAGGSEPRTACEHAGRRHQLGTLGNDQPVIPGVPFIR